MKNTPVTNNPNLDAMQRGQCPNCGADWDGGSIVDTFIKQRDEGNRYWEGKSDAEIEKVVKESYAAPYRWRREIGIELALDHPQHYDGVSYWKCPDCHVTINRFTGNIEEIT